MVQEPCIIIWSACDGRQNMFLVDDYLLHLLFVMLEADLERAASGAFGHFVGNHAILRTFWVKYPVLLTKDAGRSVEAAELRLDKGYLRYEYWE